MKHVTVTSGHDVLLIERFDRRNNNGKINRKHFVSGLTMLNEHESYIVQIDSEKHSYGALPDVKPYNLLGIGVGPMGRQATMANAQEGAQVFGLTKDEAKNIIEKICNISKNWKKHFTECQVSDRDIQKLEKNFQCIDVDMDEDQNFDYSPRP